MSEELARDIVRTLRDAGREAYFVGGCVRDRLLGREPKDYDVATAAPSDEVRALFPDGHAVGASFGVILVRRDEAEVEVATFRQDLGYHDGRRPDRVVFTPSAEEDAQRRDFTVNGLFYDPVEDRVVDYVSGRADLEARLLRAVGDPEVRFAEDKLRMLRAVRFAAHLSFEIEPDTKSAIRRNAPKIHEISTERVRDEINCILTEGGARRGFELLEETGLLQAILPEVAALRGVEQSPEHHPEGDVWTHTLLMLEGLEAGCSKTLAMGVLLHDIGKPGTFQRAADRIRFHGHVELGIEIAGRICRRLRYSNAESEQIQALVANHMKFMHLTQMRPGKLKRFLRAERFEEHLELHRLDCASSHGKLDNWRFARDRIAELGSEELRPPPLLTGDDLIKEGLKPSPLFSELLEEIEEAQLDGKITSREEACAWLRRRQAHQRAESAQRP